MNGNLDSFFYTDPSQQSWLQTHENALILVVAVLFVIAGSSWLTLFASSLCDESKDIVTRRVAASAALVFSVALTIVLIKGYTTDPTPAKVVSDHYGVGATDTPCPGEAGEAGECVFYVDKEGSKTILQVSVGDRDEDKDGWPVTVERLGSASKEPATK
mgnify:FL=1